MANISTLHEDEDLLIRGCRGSSSHLVLAFTGIGHQMGKLQRDEFVGTALGGAANSALFVTDKRRSWYSHPGLADRAVAQIARWRDAWQARTVSAIGNSMGGYGALLFSARVPMESCIAFAPQISMHRDVIREPRWPELRKGLGAALVRSADDLLATRCTYFIVFGADSPEDSAQAALLTPRPNVHRIDVPGSRHSVAEDLKTRGLSRDLIAAMFRRDRQRVDALLSTYDPRPGHPAAGESIQLRARGA